MKDRRPPFESTDRPPFATFDAETMQMADGRQVTWYAWPDPAHDPTPSAPPDAGEPQEGPDRV